MESNQLAEAAKKLKRISKGYLDGEITAHEAASLSYDFLGRASPDQLGGLCLMVHEDVLDGIKERVSGVTEKTEFIMVRSYCGVEPAPPEPPIDQAKARAVAIMLRDHFKGDSNGQRGE